MAGACKALKDSNCALVGGHTCEGKEMALGFSINGTIEKGTGGANGFGLQKGGLEPGHALVLTKPVGTGVIFAARMRNKCKGRHVTGALASMCTSNRQAAQLALKHKAR